MKAFRTVWRLTVGGILIIGSWVTVQPHLADTELNVAVIVAVAFLAVGAGLLGDAF